MRIAALLSIAVALSGCVHPGAKPMRFTCGDLLAGNIESYQSTPTPLGTKPRSELQVLLAEVQRDAGRDECSPGKDGVPVCSAGAPAIEIAHDLYPGPGAQPDPIIEALRARTRQDAAQLTGRTASTATNTQPEIPVLMLSGGGSWGAFGAGYLNMLGKKDWAVVTGVSTGALQGLFVAAGDYEALEAAYRITEGGELATSNGLLGMLSRGSENDIAPLRKKVMAYLLPSNGTESPLYRMARAGSPAYSIATVEARSGDLKVVHVTQLVRRAFAAKRPLSDVAECVAGVALASSSIPVRLTPVQIDNNTYTDGGVRSSVFDAGIGDRMRTFADAPTAQARPHLYVIRNGPTIVFRDKEEKDRPGIAEVDARPDILRLGMRGYSTIVNQNELMSILSLRLNYPRGPISVISADGFNAPENPGFCGRRPDALFDKDFMRCLADWGRYKAEHGPPFIELDELDVQAHTATH